MVSGTGITNTSHPSERKSQEEDAKKKPCIMHSFFLCLRTIRLLNRNGYVVDVEGRGFRCLKIEGRNSSRL